MILPKYILFFVIAFFYCLANTFAELPSVYTYPPQYENITERDWENTRKQIETILSYTRLTDAEPEFFSDVLYKITRLSQIQISDNRKKEISVFIINSILKMLKQEKFLEGSFPTQDEDIELVSDQKRYGQIIFTMLHCYGRVATTFDHNEFIELWNLLLSKQDKQPLLADNIKPSLFVALKFQIKSKNALLFLQEIKDTTKVNEKEKKIIMELIEIHNYAIIADETLLWQTFCEKNKPHELNDVLQVGFIDDIFNKTWQLINVLQDLNYNIPLDLSETCANWQEKYMLVLFSNILAMKILDSSEQPSDSFIIFFLNLETATKKLTGQIESNYPNFLSNKMTNYNQYLFDENKIKLKKLQESYEKKRLEEEQLRQHSNSQPITQSTLQSTTKYFLLLLLVLLFLVIIVALIDRRKR